MLSTGSGLHPLCLALRRPSIASLGSRGSNLYSMFKVGRRATFSSEYFFCSRSPGHHVPWWVLIWLKRSPLVFLVLSVSCFSIGLVFFSYSSRQVCDFFKFRKLLFLWRLLDATSELCCLYYHDGVHRI